MIIGEPLREYEVEPLEVPVPVPDFVTVHDVPLPDKEEEEEDIPA